MRRRLMAQALVSPAAVRRRYNALPDHEPFSGRLMRTSMNRLASLQGKLIDVEIVYWKSYQLSTLGDPVFGLRWTDLDVIEMEDPLQYVKEQVVSHQYTRYNKLWVDFSGLYDLLVRTGKMSAEERLEQELEDNQLYIQLKQRKNV